MSIYTNNPKETAAGTMVTNAQNAILYDENRQEIGQLVDGQLQTSRTDIWQIHVLGITADGDEEIAQDNIMLSLPAGGYIVKNEDVSEEDFTVCMADINLSVWVSTKADQVELKVNDADNEASASIDAGPGERYDIKVQSTMPEQSGFISASGMGNGEIVELSQVNGTVHKVNLEQALIQEGTLDSDYQDGDISGKNDDTTDIDSGKTNGTGTNIDEPIKKGDILLYGSLRYKVNRTDGSDRRADVTCIGMKEDVESVADIPNQFNMGGVVCTVTKIGTGAFAGNDRLVSVKLLSTVKSIGGVAFKNCTKIKKITIPAKVVNIGKEAFYGCSSLKRIIIKTKKLKAEKVGVKAFKNINAKASIKVPKEKLKAYKKLLKAKGIGNKVKLKV